MTRSLALRYALAPVCVALAVLLHLSPAGAFLHPTGLFLLCIVAAGWFGGAGPGLLAAVLATFALPQLIAMSDPLVGGFFDLPHFVTFGITGLAVGWGATRRRRAEAALRESEKKLEHKVAERTAALRDSEERYALAMQAAEDAHWDWNIATDEYFATADKFPMYGFAPDFKFANREDFLARAPFHPEDRRKWNEAVKTHLAGTGDRLSMDLRLLMNGETRWVHISGLCVRDASGAPLRWIGTTRDVTDRKRMELAQRASDERYARAMEASNDGLWEWNPATDEIFVTARARELWAIPEGVPIRTRADLYVHGAFHAEDRPRIEQTIQAYLAGRTSGFDIEYRVIARTGEVHWIRSRAKAFPGAEGRPALVTGSLTDVTERKRAEEALRESEQRYERAMLASNAGLWEWDARKDEYYMSPRHLELLGFAPGTTFSGREDFLRRVPFHPQDLERWKQAQRQLFASGGSYLVMDLRVIGNAETRWVRVNALCFRDAAGTVVRWTGSVTDVTEAKRAEEALRRSEERYSLAMEASEEGHFDVNLDTDEHFISERLNEIHGFQPGMRTAKRSEFIKHVRFYGDDAEKYHGAIAAAEAKDGPERYECEFRIVRPSGEVRWLSTRGKVTRDAEGRAVRRTGVVTDITERKLAADVLRESEARFRSLTELSSDSYWQQDENLRFLPTSETHDLGGYPAHSNVGKTRWELDNVTPLSCSWIEHQAVLAARQPFREFEYRRIGPDGAARYISASGTPIFDEQGRFKGYEGVARNITERKRIEEALRLSEERYSRAMEAAQEGHWDWNIVTDEIFLSERYKAIIGLPPEAQFANRTEFISLMPLVAEDRQKVLDAIQAALAGSSTLGYEVDYRVYPRPGEVRWVRSRGKVFRDEHGKPVQMTGSVTDITERKLAADVLRESEARFRTLTELSSDWYWEQDENLRFTYLSSQAKALTGYSGESSLGKTRWEIENMEPLSCSWAEHQAVLAARQPFRDLECRRIGPDGTVRYLSMSGAPVFDESGRFKGYQGIGRNITERKRAEDKVRESEARFRSLTELSSDWFWQQDENLRFVDYVPAEVGTRSGVAAKASLGRTRWEFDNVTPLSCTWEEHKAVLAARLPFRDFEYMRLDEDGTPHYTVISGVPTFDAQGRFTGYQGVGRNVSERRRFEEELRARQEMLDLAQESARAVAFEWRLTADGPERSRWSAGLAAMHGVTPESYDGSLKQYKKLIHPEDWPRVKEAIQHAQRTGDVAAEYRVLYPDGSVHWLQAKGRMFFDAERNPVRMVGFMEDVTQRRHADEELRSRQEMLELAQKVARAVAFEWRAEREGRWPPELEAMYGLPPGSFPGSFRPFGLERQEWKKLVHPDDWAGMNAAIQHAYDTGDVAAEYRVIHADGSVHWLQSKGRMFFDAEKNPVRMIGLIQDVTALRHAEEELKAMERKLRQAQRLEAMGTLAGGIAHDFNNILGAILGYGEMAMRDAAKGTRMRRDLESIMTAGERGRALIDRVLAFSRSSVGERVAVHVEKVVREALDLISAKLPPNVTLHAKLHAGSAAMLGDATQVHQVLMNLATNAIQAMPAGGRLGVSLRAARSEAARAPTIGMIGTGEYIVLEVADTGCGIAPEILDRIFDPFFTTKEVGTGTGLGLSLVHGIVTELGGAIDVASTPGAGSTFTVYLPRAGDAADLKESQEPEMPRGGGQRVLVVDDEEPLVRLATRTLEDLGYVPTGFTSSAAALAAFRADPQRFDALLTDERMPGMSGSALIREIRGIRNRIPIVLMSGYVGGKVASGAREAGAEEVLKKPLSARDLAGSLARVLRPT